MLNDNYRLGLAEAAALIRAAGSEVTFLLEGPMGIGKSSILKMLSEQMPTHRGVYFDATTKDVGDLTLPIIPRDESARAVRSLPHEELGLHLGQPVIVMLDEIGKASPAVRVALTRFMLERTLGGTALPPGSIVFATTNLAEEGLGDLLQPHQLNRITRVRLRPPTVDEWLEWAVNNGIAPEVIGWVRETPQALQSFEDVADPSSNPLIYHPRDAGRTAFVTPRSLEKASRIVEAARDNPAVTEQVLTAALIGTLGPRAGLDMMAFVALAHDLPRLDDIKRDPENARVPRTPAAAVMVVYRTLATIEPDWVRQWFVYMKRMPDEFAGIFVNGVRTPGYRRAATVLSHPAFNEWLETHAYMFRA